MTAAAGDPPDLWVSDGSASGTGSLRPLLPASAEVRGATTSSWCSRPSTAAASTASSGTSTAPSPTSSTRSRSSACGGDPGDLCLFGDRFRVEVEWADQRSGDSGIGTAIPFADKSGFFWFFEPQNVELVVKILDGTEVNGRFWVFYGGLSDVAYTITVTDTVSEEQAVYQNAQGDICGRGDTTAF